jgi:hypothetical protein
MGGGAALRNFVRPVRGHSKLGRHQWFGNIDSADWVEVVWRFMVGRHHAAHHHFVHGCGRLDDAEAARGDV